MAKVERIAVLGGSFDPVHIGHLLVAQDACEAMELDRVLLTPAAQAPLKSRSPGASGAQRVEMLRRAAALVPWLEVWDFEVLKGDLSFSYLTAEALRERFPQARLFWILGADQLAQLHKWKNTDRLLAEVEVICVRRPDSGGEIAQPIPPGIPADRLHFITSRLVEMSSTEVQNRLRAGVDVQFFLPAPVVDFIRSEHLYLK